MRILPTVLAAALALGAAFAAAPLGDTVNKKCPVSDQPVKDGVIVSTDKGDIGVCCNKCKATVEKWDDQKKAKFVANAIAQDQKGDAKKAQDSDAKSDKDAGWGEPYLLDTCAASGRPIDVKGTPTTKVIDGRELKFCCGGCADAVAKEPAKWLPKVDEMITARQVAIYPTDKCIVSDEPLMEGDKDVATSMVINNRLFRTCCKMCAKKVKADPAKYAAKLDAMVMDAQAKVYPLGTCVVNPRAKLTADAESMVIGGRLVQTCCGKCAKKVKADPTKYVAMVDAARAKRVSDDGDATDKQKAKRDSDGGK